MKKGNRVGGIREGGELRKWREGGKPYGGGVRGISVSLKQFSLHFDLY